jgi:hypothetical protein
MPVCPYFTDDMLMGGGDQLDRARVLLQQWLHSALVFPGVKESQVCVTVVSVTAVDVIVYKCGCTVEEYSCKWK